MQPAPNAPSSDLTAAAGLTAPVTSSAPAPVATAPAETAPAASPAVVIPPASPGIVVTAGKAPSASPLKDETPEKIALPPKPEEPVAKIEPPKAVVEDKKPATSPESRVVIRAVQSSWVMVADDTGKTVFDRVLKPGESYSVPAKPGLLLTTGNGGGIVLSLDGKDLPKIDNGGTHVVRNIALDPDRLAAQH